MGSIKQKVIEQINSIQDEGLLKDVYNVLYAMQETKGVFGLNNEQLLMVQEGMADYKRGAFQSSEDLFKELLDDED